jgi:hypothetical protein
MLAVGKYDPAKSVLGCQFGDEATLNAEDFARLATAFLSEIEAKFH